MKIRKSLIACIAIAAPALLCVAGVAQAKGELFKSRCTVIGNSAADNIGDRPDHKISVANVVCAVSGGVMEGGVMTAETIYEWDGPNATLLSGGGVLRKSGMVVVYKHTSGSTKAIKEGNATSYAATGKGIVSFASGAAAGLSGKTYSFVIVMENGKPVFEVTMD